MKNKTSDFKAYAFKVLLIFSAIISGFTVFIKCDAQSIAGKLDPTTTLSMNEKGHALKKFYLDLRVEELWISGHHIGKPGNQTTRLPIRIFIPIAVPLWQLPAKD
jgi:hypothetical protein